MKKTLVILLALALLCGMSAMAELDSADVTMNRNQYHISLESVEVKDGKLYRIEENAVQSRQAALSGLSFQGKPIEFKLCDTWGTPIPEEELYHPHYAERCRECGMHLVCSGCSDCGRCSK